ncbi:MAG TPA: hypothetical protein VFS88_04100 [Micavibrio sp.]|nr:hypothetical protein [Micavibrio sp.]
MIRLLFLTILLSVSALPSAAQTDGGDTEKTMPSIPDLGSAVTRDSVYFTMDDGIMTPNEMEKEATYIFNMCDLNVAQKNMFNCQCLAGAFLKKREALGPTVPQFDILYDLTLGHPVDCANTEALAGTTYKACMDFMTPHRSYESPEENIAYCECTANKVANDFTKTPALAPAYVRHLTYESYLYCNDPQNREKKAAQAKTETLPYVKTAN